MDMDEVAQREGSKRKEQGWNLGATSSKETWKRMAGEIEHGDLEKCLYHVVFCCLRLK